MKKIILTLLCTLMFFTYEVFSQTSNNPDADSTTQESLPSYDELKDEFEGYYEYQNQ